METKLRIYCRSSRSRDRSSGKRAAPTDSSSANSSYYVDPSDPSENTPQQPRSSELEEVVVVANHGDRMEKGMLHAASGGTSTGTGVRSSSSSSANRPYSRQYFMSFGQARLNAGATGSSSGAAAAAGVTTHQGGEEQEAQSTENNNNGPPLPPPPYRSSVISADRADRVLPSEERPECILPGVTRASLTSTAAASVAQDEDLDRGASDAPPPPPTPSHSCSSTATATAAENASGANKEHMPTVQLLVTCEAAGWCPSAAVVQYWVSAGANVLACASGMDISILSILVSQGHVDAVRACLSTPSPIDFTTHVDAGGRTLLHTILSYKNNEKKVTSLLTLFLLRLGARTHTDRVDWGQEDDAGMSFLCYAAVARKLSVVWPLLWSKQVPYFCDHGVRLNVSKPIWLDDWEKLAPQAKKRMVPLAGFLDASDEEDASA